MVYNHEKLRVKKRTYKKYPMNADSKCELCGSDRRLQRHHYTEPYEVDKFQLLCFKCHHRIHWP
jgi:hypothetical protein